jgi:hypothetical protein
MKKEIWQLHCMLDACSGEVVRQTAVKKATNKTAEVASKGKIKSGAYQSKG